MASFIAEALSPKGKGTKRRLGETPADLGFSSSDGDMMSDSSVKKKKKKKKENDAEPLEFNSIKTEPESSKGVENVGEDGDKSFASQSSASSARYETAADDTIDGKASMETVASVADDSEQAHGEASPPVNNGTASKSTWSKEETENLLENISKALPNKDNSKFSTQADRLQWEELKVGEYTGEECKERWASLVTNVRKFRTMTEILADVKTFVANPSTKGEKKHPDMPKRPLTPYFQFFLAKRSKIAAKNPNMSQTELTKVISQEFKALNEKKKKKYHDVYDKEMADYQVLLAKFKEDHPELYPEKKSGKSAKAEKAAADGPPKPTTCMQLYINSKIEEAQSKGSKASRKDLYNVYRTKFSSLSDHKKLKYIKKTLEAKAKYDKDMATYCEKHPDYQAKDVKTFLSKAEQKLKDKEDGKPDKPPPNGYGLYSTQMLGKLSNLPTGERMQEVSRQWKALPDSERENWNQSCRQKNAEYEKMYKKYVDGLPEEERQKIQAIEDEKTAKKEAKRQADKQQSAKSRSRNNQKPVAAVFLYITENKAAYKKRHPKLSEVELTRMLAKEYSQLSDIDKDKYKLMEKEQKDILAICMSDREDSPSPKPAATNKKTKAPKKQSWPGEPKKPPGSGYLMFTSELISGLTDIPSNQKMGHISQKWKAMSQSKRDAYNNKRAALVAQYKKDIEKFKKGLSAADRKKYEESETKGSKKKAAQTNSKEESEEEEEEGEESSDEESGSESGSSASSGESSSDESESGSDDDDEEEEEDEGKGKKKLNAKEVYSSDSDSDSASGSSSDDSD